MGGLIGDLLPLAIGIAISPIPIIATVLMLLSPRAATVGSAFSLGWFGGIALPATAFVLVAAALSGAERSGSRPVLGVIDILLAAMLLWIAVRQFGKRHQQAALPAWMSAVDGMTAPKGCGVGFVIAALNPKNLALAAAAGVAVGGSGLGVGAQVVATSVFAVLAASTVVLPTVAYLLQPERLATPLDALRKWLLENNAVIMSVLVLVLGVAVLGKGIGYL